MSLSTTSSSGTTGVSAPLALIGRLLLSSLFILAGFGKLTAIGATAGWFGSLGLPVPTVTTVVVGLVELLGGLAILVGFQTRIAALVLAVFTVAATLVAHTDFADGMQMLLFQKNISITGGLLLVAALGAGGLSVDGRRK
ncbi:DoxX family protein [Oryzicola mucosus]|uniref:DoxX family protein n=1 Tax=Oryzicola mucosus TaxID=2767425 RepID=A0A8J6U0J2_9HYPH|nr:DoxX family protein [Oryzicola mucosus]MBD0415736.1 DoxX family protein [Oryzicola mucosus]